MRFILLLIPFVLLACGREPPAPGPTEPPEIALPTGVSELTPAEARQWITAHPDGLILDVRMEDEVTREGKIEGAQNHNVLGWQNTEAQLMANDRSKPCLIYCALGLRSRIAAVKLHEVGFKNLSVLKGGLNTWILSGQPVVK